LLKLKIFARASYVQPEKGSSDMQPFDLLVDHGDVETELRLRICTCARREGRGPRYLELDVRTLAPVYKQNREKSKEKHACTFSTSSETTSIRFSRSNSEARTVRPNHFTPSLDIPTVNFQWQS
jgi:hypothetical protein